MQITQEDKILDKLIKEGYFDNFWCIKNFILRAGMHAHHLRGDGYNLIGIYGDKINNYTPKEKLKNRKNWHYILKKRCVENKDGTVTLK